MFDDDEYDEYEPLLHDEPANQSELNAWVAYPAPTIGGVCGYFNWATFTVDLVIDNDRYLYNRKWRYLGAPKSYSRALKRQSEDEYMTPAEIEKFVDHILLAHWYPQEKTQEFRAQFSNIPGCRWIDVRWDEIAESWRNEKIEAWEHGDLDDLAKLPWE